MLLPILRAPHKQKKSKKRKKRKYKKNKKCQKKKKIYIYIYIYISVEKNILELPGNYQKLVEEGHNIQNWKI
jgi:hypothetical protein